jgi:tetratricopeptide (TPR) repeat protein
MFLTMSLRAECYRWCERAISALDDASRGGAEEMHLQASLGASSMHMYGQSDATRAALERALHIAEGRGDLACRAELVSMLTMFHTRAGHFKTALHYARLGQFLARTVADATAVAVAHSVLGRSLHITGDHGGARAAFETAHQYWSNLPETNDVCLGFDHQILVGAGLARTLWLQGHPAQAVERIHQTIQDAERRNNPVFSLGFALFWAPGIFLWVGDLRSAEEYADRLISNGERHFRTYECAAGRGYKGALAIGRGNVAAGVEDLQMCLEQLHAVRYEMLNTEFKVLLVQGLMAIGRLDEALTLIDKTIGLMAENGDLLHMPEALRVKGNVLLSCSQRRADNAETSFIQSLDCSRRQGARSWELRTAADLAGLWAADGHRGRAHDLLQPIVATFAEGRDTADVKAAEQLLTTLQ